MQNNIIKYTYILLMIGLISCQSISSRINKNLKFAEKNIELFKKAKGEIIAYNKISKGKYYNSNDLKIIIKRDSNNNLKSLKAIFDQDLFIKNDDFIAIDYSNDSLIDFHIWNSEGAIDIITYDPLNSWIERRGVIGQVDDYGFNNLTKIDNNWYFVSTWFK